VEVYMADILVFIASLGTMSSESNNVVPIKGRLPLAYLAPNH